MGRDKEIEFSFHSRNGGTRRRKMKFEGVVANIDRRYHESPSEYTREMMSRYMTELPCETCHGKRLSKEALSVYVGGYNIGEVVEYSIKNALKFYENIELSEQDKAIAKQILIEIISRLTFLNNVGLDYLTLNRSSEHYRWRSTTYSSCYSNWITIDRRALCIRRTFYRVTSTR